MDFAYHANHNKRVAVLVVKPWTLMITFDSIFAMLAANSDTPCSSQDGRHACPPKFLTTCAARGARRASTRKNKIFSIFVSDPMKKEEKIIPTFKFTKKRVQKVQALNTKGQFLNGVSQIVKKNSGGKK
jgi:hypothetical protein